MEQATLGGTVVQYEVVGTGEPLVLIHGAFIADAFGPLMTEPALRDRYRLIRYHRRGYAGSGRGPGRGTVPEQAADCLALLRHLDVERAHVAGHSYGGAVALQLALDAPDAVRSLALLESSVAAGVSLETYRDGLARGIQRYRDVGPRVVVEEFLGARFGAGYRAFLDRRLPGWFEQAVTDGAAAFELDVAGMGEWVFGEAQARRVTQPALVVLGARSVALQPRYRETHELLIAWLPHAEGFVLPDAAHALQMENPSAAATSLSAFFARHPVHGRR